MTFQTCVESVIHTATVSISFRKEASAMPTHKCALLLTTVIFWYGLTEEQWLADQLQRLRDYIASRVDQCDEDWAEIDVYESEKDFERLFEDIRQKRVNVILALSLDPPVLSAKQVLNLLDVATEKAVTLIALDDDTEGAPFEAWLLDRLLDSITGG